MEYKTKTYVEGTQSQCLNCWILKCYSQKRWSYLTMYKTCFSQCGPFVCIKAASFNMGLDAWKPVFGGLRTIQAQTSLRIRAVWSAPLLFAYWKVLYLDYFNFLASLCNGEHRTPIWNIALSENPEDRFSRVESHIIPILKLLTHCGSL